MPFSLTVMLDFSKLQEQLDAMQSGDPAEGGCQTVSGVSPATSGNTGENPAGDAGGTVVSSGAHPSPEGSVTSGPASTAGETVVGSARVEVTHTVAASGGAYIEDDISVEEAEWFGDEGETGPAAGKTSAAGQASESGRRADPGASSVFETQLQDGSSLSEFLETQLQALFNKSDFGSSFFRPGDSARTDSRSSTGSSPKPSAEVSKMFGLSDTGPSDGIRSMGDELLDELQRAADMFVAQGATRSYAGLKALLDRAAIEAEKGDSLICEQLALVYSVIDDDDAIGMSRKMRSQRAVAWFYKAVCDTEYRRRGDCGQMIAELSFLPKFDNVNLKQAKDWFGWSFEKMKTSAPGKAAAACLYLGRIAEMEKAYDEAAAWWAKHDEISGTRRGAAERCRMEVFRGLDEEKGIMTLKTMLENGDPYAAVVLVELRWICSLSDELRAGIPYDLIESVLRRHASLPDARAALGALLLSSENFNSYVADPESFEFHRLLTDAYKSNSVLAAFFLGEFYLDQFNHALGANAEQEVLADAAVDALFYLRQAAGMANLTAINDYAVVNAVSYGFDEETARYCDFLDLFGEHDSAERLRAGKDKYNEIKVL